MNRPWHPPRRESVLRKHPARGQDDAARGFGYTRRMNHLEAELAEVLDALEAAARDPQRPSLQPLFERIDRLAAQLPPQADPELRHFLQRKSYTKARERLHGRAVKRGSCGA